MVRNAKSYAALWVAGLAGLAAWTVETNVASATLLTGSYDTIYSDGFTSQSAGTLLGGNSPDVASGLDGGTAGATWNAATTTVASITSTASDVDWQYGGGGTATITTPNANKAAQDTNLIANALLPFTPVANYLYDLEATIQSPAAGTDSHWIGLTFMNGNSHGASGSASALSNDDPWGLVIVRDGVNPSPDWVTVFDGTGGGTGTSLALNPAGGVGTTLTIDILLNSATNQESWYIDGTQVGPTVTLNTGYITGSGGDGLINDVAFGDDTAPLGTVSQFSLTAQSVPEPACLGLLCVGSLFALRRRSRSQAQ
jgi:hypothetical protein